MPQLEIDNDVINHLLFHKSLIDEKDDSSRINYYINLVKQADDGEHISIENQFDRSIALAFELVMQQHLNPWDIDLVSFSTMYLKHAKEKKIDLITAGRIIYLAWKVLKLQSNDLVLNVESQKETYEPLEWGDIPTEMWLSKDDAYSYTNLVTAMTEPPLDEPLRRNSERKVTLIELITAFEKARKESEEYQLIELQRKEERELLSERARKRMKGTAVEDHLEKDVETVWNKIKEFSKKTVTINDLCEKNNKDELIKIFISLLFLAMDDKVLLYQKKFPYGKIFIKNK